MKTRVIRDLTNGILVFVCLSFVWGCAATNPAPRRPVPVAPMVKVDGGSLPQLAFDNIVVDIPDQRAIGYHYTGLEYTRGHDYRWGSSFVHETDELNYASRELLLEAGYRVAQDGDGPLRLVGTMGNVFYNSYERKVSFDQAECVISWALFKDGLPEPIFRTETKGSGRVELGKTGAFKAAYEAALRRLLANPGLSDALRDS